MRGNNSVVYCYRYDYITKKGVTTHTLFTIRFSVILIIIVFWYVFELCRQEATYMCMYAEKDQTYATHVVHLLGPSHVVNLPLVFIVEVVKHLLGPGSTGSVCEKLLIHGPERHSRCRLWSQRLWSQRLRHCKVLNKSNDESLLIHMP